MLKHLLATETRILLVGNIETIVIKYIKWLKPNYKFITTDHVDFRYVKISNGWQNIIVNTNTVRRQPRQLSLKFHFNLERKKQYNQYRVVIGGKRVTDWSIDRDNLYCYLDLYRSRLTDYTERLVVQFMESGKAELDAFFEFRKSIARCSERSCRSVLPDEGAKACQPSEANYQETAAVDSF